MFLELRAHIGNGLSSNSPLITIFGDRGWFVVDLKVLGGCFGCCSSGFDGGVSIVVVVV